MDDGNPTKIEQVLAVAPVAGARPLPMGDVCQAVLYPHAFAQPGSSLRRLLAGAQLVQAPFTIVLAWQLSQLKSVSKCRLCVFALSVPAPVLVYIGMADFHSSPSVQAVLPSL